MSKGLAVLGLALVLIDLFGWTGRIEAAIDGAREKLRTLAAWMLKYGNGGFTPIYLAFTWLLAACAAIAFMREGPSHQQTLLQYAMGFGLLQLVFHLTRNAKSLVMRWLICAGVLFGLGVGATMVETWVAPQLGATRALSMPLVAAMSIGGMAVAAFLVSVLVVLAAAALLGLIYLLLRAIDKFPKGSLAAIGLASAVVPLFLEL